MDTNLNNRNFEKWKAIWLLFLSVLLFFPFSKSYSQSGTISGDGSVTYNQNGSVTVTGGTLTFTSHVISYLENIDYMVQLDAISLLRANADLTGGIKCQADNGTVTLSVYSYDENSQSGKGAVLYRMTVDRASNSTDFIGWPVPIPSPVGSSEIDSDQIKVLMNGANTWLVDKSKCLDLQRLNLFTTTMAYINAQSNPSVASSLNECLKGNNYKLRQPIIVETIINNATVMSHGLKIPGLVGEFDLQNYFDPNKILTVTVKVNGEARQTYTAGIINLEIIDLTLGDSVTYDITYPGSHAPEINGMPGVWIARFAGDLMYYCSPSVKPNEFSPWIGYDSRVHTLQLRNFDGDTTFRVRVPDWSRNQANALWSWSYFAERRMDVTKSQYIASHTWPKYKTLNNGSKQRNNQREGLNVQFLQYWQNGENSDFREYTGDAQFMMGFDDDELLYLNSQYHDAISHPPGPGGGIVKLDSLPSRGMPEGFDQIYDVATGYPAQGFPLNMIISAYRKNREWLVKENSNFFEKYDGYEIQDIGTDENHPDGIGKGNNTAPGIVTIRAGNQLVFIRLSVKAPLTEDKGHYGIVEGNRWPAYYETEIPYTLTGLLHLSFEELDKFSLEYQGSDALGNLRTQTKYIKDLSNIEKNRISNTGECTLYFDNNSPTYSAITVYYQRTPSSKRVIVGGKELKPIFLLFIGEKNLEGKGLGAKIWLNDFRDERTDEYNVPRQFGNKTRYTKQFVRTYTFPLNTTTTFETWDGDPHLFYDPGTEWFLSSRTLAKRIPDNYLDGTNFYVNEPYLKYYIDGVEQVAGRSGKDFTYTWTTAGIHSLKVEYRVAGNLTTYEHQIKIIDYPQTSPNNRPLGTISIRRGLTPQEGRWLGITNLSNYFVFEVKDVYSNFQYKDGPRANAPYVNRWAELNDYASNYNWNRMADQTVRNFLNRYSFLDWFWFNWALHYSSNWRDNLPNGLPPYVGDSQVTRVVDTQLDNFAPKLQDLFNTLDQAKWQYTVPLVSFTDFQGYRMRTNPSCLYDLNTVWANDYGAFTGDVILPDDPNQIQAPDITDEQKELQEFYYDLKSGRKTIVMRPIIPVPMNLTVHNNAAGGSTFIAETMWNPN